MLLFIIAQQGLLAVSHFKLLLVLKKAMFQLHYQHLVDWFKRLWDFANFQKDLVDFFKAKFEIILYFLHQCHLYLVSVFNQTDHLMCQMWVVISQIVMFQIFTIHQCHWALQINLLSMVDLLLQSEIDPQSKLADQKKVHQVVYLHHLVLASSHWNQISYYYCYQIGLKSLLKFWSGQTVYRVNPSLIINLS